MKRNIVPILMLILSCCLAVLSFVLLPESVLIQFSIGSSENTVVPKLIAILIPFVLGISGTAIAFFAKENEKAKSKGILLSLVGIVLFIVMIVVNCLVI